MTHYVTVQRKKKMVETCSSTARMNKAMSLHLNLKQVDLWNKVNLTDIQSAKAF